MSEMVIVEDRKTFEKIKQEVFKTKSICAVTVLSDVNKHAAINPPSVLILGIPTIDKIVILPFVHNDALSIPREWVYELEPKAWIVPDKKTFLHAFPTFTGKCFDYKLVEYLNGNKFDIEKFYHSTMIHMYQTFSTQKNINRAVPILQLTEYAINLINIMKSGIEQCIQNASQSDFLYIENEYINEALHWIESSGLHCKTDKIIEKYGNRIRRNLMNDIIYTSYNPYTSTGRSPATGGGINFTALNKTDGSRDLFDSRFPNGKLILIDFDSFHLRIIAKLMSYNLPDGSIHEHLAKQYFQKNEITQNEYDQSKQQTFHYLYSDSRMTTAIEFFDEIYKYQDDLWAQINHQGFITSSRGRKIYLDRIENATPAKVFNYLIQLEETEISMSLIMNLKKLWKNFKSKVILYTYDSLLIDYSPEDGESFANFISQKLSNNGEWPVKIYEGLTYHNMNQFKIGTSNVNS